MLGISILALAFVPRTSMLVSGIVYATSPESCFSTLRIIDHPNHQINALYAKSCQLSTKSSPDQLFRVTERNCHTKEVKKSKFIVHIAPAANIDIALEFLNEVKNEKASHNCWAYRSETYERFSDDGEPSGTAGRPILRAIVSERVVDCVAVVVRHFGGVKLGTGGLARAYGSATREALQNMNKTELKKINTECFNEQQTFISGKRAKAKK